jgi:hypothetical protein
MHDVIKKEEVKWPIIVGHKNIIIQHVKTLKKMGGKKSWQLYKSKQKTDKLQKIAVKIL